MAKQNSGYGSGRSGSSGVPGRPFLPSNTPTGFEMGVVITNSEKSADGSRLYFVRLDNREGQARNIEPKAERLLSHPGDESVLPVGTRVVLMRVGGRAFIMGAMAHPPEIPHIPVDETRPGVDQMLSGHSQLLRGPRGNHVAVMDNGLTSVGSPTAAIRMTTEGHLDLMTETYSQQTAMWESRIESPEPGEFNWVFRAGRYLDTQTGLLPKNPWPFRVDLGADGDLFKVRVTDGTETPLAQIHMTSDGALDYIARAGRSSTIYGTDVTTVTGTASRTVSSKDTLAVTGTRAENYGRYEQVVAGGAVLSVGSTRQVAVVGKQFHTVLGDDYSMFRGRKTVESLGDYQHVIGNPLAIPPPGVPAASWVNYLGGYNFYVANPAKGFTVYTTGPGSVNLGINGTVVRDPLGNFIITPTGPYLAAVIHEYLDSWLQELLMWLDRHVHGSAMGPTTPPVELVSPALSARTVSFRSTKVTLGG